MEWAKSVVCAKKYLMTVEDAISAFVADLETLFVGYPNNGYTQFAYFRADLRMPIMQAGRTQTLLKIIYKGEERLVEPYSLKYQQRRDGVEREYFFAHKLSGGASEPGTKRFVSEHMSSIENTDTKFVPRHQIELSKAGETPENRYLFDPNRPTPAPRPRKTSGLSRTPRRSSFGPKYIYQCNSCGKKFIKSKHDNSIRQHKDKNGYSCGGRYGFYVDMKY
jgi:DNA-directed RNA polymerase subunit RPC12/RpoP